jgi:sorbitol-specific phosphotransferase system component IIBC
VWIGEVTSLAQKGYKKKNAKDLVRVGLSLKDAMDFIQDEFGVHDAVLVGWQVIGPIMAIYLMFKRAQRYNPK